MTSTLNFLKKNELINLADDLNIKINTRYNKELLIDIISNYIRKKKKNGSYGTYNIQGRREYMEDRNFQYEDSKYIISGIFDGHGGSECSTYMNRNFLKYFVKYLNNPYYKKNIQMILKSTLSHLNNNFLNIENTSGSTGNIVVIDKINGIFYNMNIGDSRCISYCNKNINLSKVKQISKDHNFTYKKEINIVKSKGGYIKDDRLMGRLAMSRALGNKELSKYIEYTPDIFYGNIKNHYYFLHGSDGLFDVLSNKIIIKIINKLLLENISFNKICKYLVELAYKKGSSDNITCSLIFFPEIN